MTVQRRIAAPPELQGYTYVDLLGSGGFADVFLYQQQKPRRHVAIKVLIVGAGGPSATSPTFAAEADLMAMVSEHPFIVQVFEADIAPDGRPFLVMEYYPGENFLQRCRHERFGVADVLRTGVQVASAVETAHRAGILHRDIKPANILTNAYGRPGLTDFGIAAIGEGNGDADGLSIPWSPPESFGSGPLGVQADVYSLAATLHHLLVGHSPFEVRGGANSSVDLMTRIQRSPVPAIGRIDVPMSLELVLAHAMDKAASNRPSSVAELARSLQEIETQLQLAVTKLELADARPVRRVADDDDERTVIRDIVQIQSQPTLVDAGPDAAATRRVTEPNPVLSPADHGAVAQADVDETVVPRRDVADLDEPAGPARRPIIVLAASVLAVLALAGIVALALRGGGSADLTETTVEGGANNDGVDGSDPPSSRSAGIVTELHGSSNGDGTFTFAWTAPTNAPDGIQYQVTELETDTREPLPHRPQDERGFTGEVPCVQVSSVSAGRLSAPVRACATGEAG